MSAARVAFARAAGAAGRLRGGMAADGAAPWREPPISMASGAGRFSSAFLGGGHAPPAQCDRICLQTLLEELACSSYAPVSQCQAGRLLAASHPGELGRRRPRLQRFADRDAP